MLAMNALGMVHIWLWAEKQNKSPFDFKLPLKILILLISKSNWNLKSLKLGIAVAYPKRMRLYHLLDGDTNLKYKLLCFLTPNKKNS